MAAIEVDPHLADDAGHQIGGADDLGRAQLPSDMFGSFAAAGETLTGAIVGVAGGWGGAAAGKWLFDE